MRNWKKKQAEREANANAWKALAAHVQTNEEAFELLQKVFWEIGPYGADKIKDATLIELCKFFDWDDSE